MNVTILDATAADLAEIRELFLAYADWLGDDLCFQGFEGDYDNPMRGARYFELYLDPRMR